MDIQRLFIALPVEPALSQHIFKQFQSLNLPWEKLKLANTGQLHLTLKFLGDVPLSSLPKLIKALYDLDSKIGDIELNIYQTKIFNPQRPQVLNLAIKDNPNLQKLYDAIDQKLYEESLAHKEIRKFRPHLTLARVKKSADISEFEEFTKLPIDKNFTVSYFELIESELSSRGPIYTVLQTFDL